MPLVVDGRIVVEERVEHAIEVVLGFRDEVLLDVHRVLGAGEGLVLHALIVGAQRVAEHLEAVDERVRMARLVSAQAQDIVNNLYLAITLDATADGLWTDTDLAALGIQDAPAEDLK